MSPLSPVSAHTVLNISDIILCVSIYQSLISLSLRNGNTFSFSMKILLISVDVRLLNDTVL